MAARPSWKSFIRLSLVTIPVRGYTAHSTEHELPLHQVHAKCHSRIRYKKTCPRHGEVSKEEIVSGYEFSKGHYVEMDRDEVDKLRTEGEKAIAIESFVKPDAIDPAYYSGQTYYLLPEGAVAEKPYQLLHEGMASRKRYAVARTVMKGKEQLVLLRPMGKLIALEILHYAAKVKEPARFEGDIVDKKTAPEETKLVETLIDNATAKRFDLGHYKDTYKSKLKELIDAKVKGKEITMPPDEDKEPHILNLMDALKRSVQMHGGDGDAPAHKKTSRRRAPHGARKRKTG